MRLLAIYKRLEPSADNQNKTLPVPRYITIMQKCVEHKIQDVFIRNSHFNDLYVLIIATRRRNNQYVAYSEITKTRRMV